MGIGGLAPRILNFCVNIRGLVSLHGRSTSKARTAVAIGPAVVCMVRTEYLSQSATPISKGVHLVVKHCIA